MSVESTSPYVQQCIEDALQSGNKNPACQRSVANVRAACGRILDTRTLQPRHQGNCQEALDAMRFSCGSNVRARNDAMRDELPPVTMTGRNCALLMISADIIASPVQWAGRKICEPSLMAPLCQKVGDVAQGISNHIPDRVVQVAQKVQSALENTLESQGIPREQTRKTEHSLLAIASVGIPFARTVKVTEGVAAPAIITQSVPLVTEAARAPLVATRAPLIIPKPPALVTEPPLVKGPGLILPKSNP